MNQEEYIRWKGSCFLEKALQSYHALDLRSSLAIQSEEENSLFWTYILYRLYETKKAIYRFHSGFGCLHAMARGIDECLEDLPLSLRTLAMKKEMDGAPLILGNISILTPAFIEEKFRFFAALEEKGLPSLSSPSGKLSRNTLSTMRKEMDAYLKDVEKELTSCTPLSIASNTRKMTFTPPAADEWALADSNIVTFLSALTISCLILL